MPEQEVRAPSHRDSQLVFIIHKYPETFPLKLLQLTTSAATHPHRSKGNPVSFLTWKSEQAFRHRLCMNYALFNSFENPRT